MQKNALDWIAHVLVVVGALNWGLVGVGGLASGNWNLVELIFGAWPMVVSVVYLLVGLSGLWVLLKMFKK